MLKYENRFKKILEKFLNEREIVNNYEKNIIVIITFADYSRNPNEDFEKICSIFEGYCENIIFYSDKSDNSKMADLMFACMSNMQRQTFNISDEEFHLKFNLQSFLTNEEISEKYRNHEQNFKEIDRDYRKFVLEISPSLQNDTEKNELFQGVIVSHKNELMKNLENFTTEFADTMHDVNNYCMWINLQKQILRICDDFSTFIVTFMNINFRDPNDPRNQYKRCPYCKTVWVKVTGCENVDCGERMNKNDETDDMPLKRYEFFRQNGKVIYFERNKNIVFNIFDAVTELVNFISTKQNIISTKKEKSIGCGKRFNWNTEAVPLTDKEICSLYKVNTIEQVKELIRSEVYSNLTKEYVKNFDTNFH